MATTVEASAPSDRGASLVGFALPSASLPVRPGAVIQWSLVVLALANLGRIPSLSMGQRDAAIVLNDVCVVGLAAVGLVTALFRRSLWLDAAGIFALLFAGVGFVSAVSAVPRFGLSGYELFVSLMYLARWLAYFGLYLFVINNVTTRQVSAVWRTLSSVMLIFAAFGVFQSIFLPGFAQIVYPNSGHYDWDEQGHRLVSTVLDPNLAASMIMLVLLIQLAQLSIGVRIKIWQPTLLLVALVLTLSRGAIVGLIAGLIVIVVARGLSKRLLKLFGAVLFLSVGVLPQLLSFAQSYARFDVGEGTSAGARVAAWVLAFEVIRHHPIIGVGFNTYGFIKEATLPLLGASSFSTDGGLLFVTVMTGVVGLSLYIFMLGSVISRCRRIWNNPARSAEHRGIALGTAAGIVAVCVHSLFANSIFTTFVMEIMWITWGLTFAIDRGPSWSSPEVPPIGVARRLASS